MPYPSTAIANAFLERAFAEGKALTHMQLQKLVYIAHGWNLAVNGEPLISDRIEAWDYGPVLPELYRHAKYFGAKPITRPITDEDANAVTFFTSGGEKPRGKPYKAQLKEREVAVIDRVWKRYGQLSAFQLSDITHREGTPWYETFFRKGKSEQIDNDLIKSHYVEIAKKAA